MVNSKNSLNLKKDKNTFKKSISSRPQVDGISKKNRLLEIDDSTNNSLLIKKENKILPKKVETIVEPISNKSSIDDNKRMFLKVAGVAGLGLAASALFPKGADAYVTGSTPTSNVVGLKDATNTRINPATDETLNSLISGQGVTKLTTSLSSSGIVRTPASGKKIRVYASRFSLTADAASVSFRFTSGGTDHEKYVSPKTGGLYGANNHPNYIEGGVDQVLYCAISGTTMVQINIDYLEV
jgi:hypothetical protein